MTARRRGRGYWILKNEPTSYSLDDLKRDKKTRWDGVRNYQARNFMRDDMRVGDIGFFYYSNCDEPGIYGLVTIASKAYPDPTQFDKKSKYYDEKATKENPRWWLVDVKFKKKLKQPILLAQLRNHPDLKGLLILQPGSRLSVTPVGKKEADVILEMIA